MIGEAKLSILIPVYNEVNSIIPILDKIASVALEKEIIIVDDCSSDGTREILRERFADGKGNVKVLYHSKNMGKGSAIKSALNKAVGEYAIIQDADLEYDPADYLTLMEAAQKNDAGVVFGSRFLKTWKSTSLWHFLVNKTLTVITNLLYGTRLTDMETCYKMIKTVVFKSLNIESERFEIEAEIAAKLARQGIKIIEVPVFYKGRSYHEGKKITWKDGVSTILALIKYKFLK
jgi:glycosyltransferase involved in cell wall biosynthesis